MKKYILLDWDGNLAKTLDIWLEAFRLPLQNRGIDLTDKEIASGFGQFGRYIKSELGLKDAEAILDEADKIAKNLMPEVALYPDAIEVLEELRSRGKKTALVTTTLHENVAHLLEKFNMNSYFDVIVAGDDVRQHKPHPESLEKALKLLHGTKDEAVMIGDSDKDLNAAENAGIDSILFYPPEHRKFYSLKRLQDYHPTHVVHDFREVLNIV